MLLCWSDTSSELDIEVHSSASVIVLDEENCIGTVLWGNGAAWATVYKRKIYDANNTKSGNQLLHVAAQCELQQHFKEVVAGTVSMCSKLQ